MRQKLSHLLNNPARPAVFVAKLAGDILRLKSSYGLDPILDGFAFSTETLYQRYRDPEHVPPRIRARLYLVTWTAVVRSVRAHFDQLWEISLFRWAQDSTILSMNSGHDEGVER